MTDIVLLFHGSRYPSTQKEADELSQNLQQQVPASRLSIAWLQNSTPSLPDVLEKLVASNTTQITILPLFTLTGRHVEYDIPRLVEDFKERQPTVSIVLAPHLGADPDFAGWLARKIYGISTQQSNTTQKRDVSS